MLIDIGLILIAYGLGLVSGFYARRIILRRRRPILFSTTRYQMVLQDREGRIIGTRTTLRPPPEAFLRPHGRSSIRYRKVSQEGAVATYIEAE